VHTRTNQEGKYEIGIEFFEFDQNSIELLKRFISEGGVESESTADIEE